MKSSIYIKGLDQLEKNANKIVREVNKEKRQILLKQARVVRDEVKRRAPVGPTGNLKRAVYATSLPETITSSAVAFAGIRPRKAPHAHLVEYGHGGPHPAPPHPFFRPAWDSVKDRVSKAVEEGLGKAINGSI